MDRFLAMQAFTKVAETGGFAAAAREMGLSRSVVNKYVIALENDLGTQLLQRSTRRVTLTEVGMLFHDRAVAILNDVAEATAAVAQLQEHPRGTLRVNAPMTFGFLHLSPVVADFMARYPDVHVDMLLNDRLVDPIEEGFDVTVRIAEESDSTSLVTRRIRSVRRILCASPAYVAASGEPREPADLRSHRCVHYGYQASGRQWKLVGPRGPVSATVNCVMWSNNGDLLKQVALRGQGIALLPDFIVDQELRAGTLRTVLDDHHADDLALCALYPRYRHQSTKTRLFVEMLVAAFEPGLSPAWPPT